MLEFLFDLFSDRFAAGQAKMVYGLIVVYGLCALSVVALYKVFKKQTEQLTTAQASNDAIPSTQSAMNLVKGRRSIMPKDMSGEKLTKADIELVLEAANWAPSHNGTEPWRYAVVEGSEGISDYLDIIENWYGDNKEDIPEAEYSRFLSKMSNARSNWVPNLSHLIVVGMARQSVPDKKNAPWEEISAVAMSVQNLHLALTTIEGAGGFWSSHSFCRRVRDHQVMRDFLGLKDEEDRVFGAFLIGKVLPGKKYKGHRRALKEKVIWK